MAPKAAEVMDEAVKKLQQTTREWKSTMEAASEDPDCLDPNCPDLRGPDGLLLQTLDGFDDEVVQEPGSEDKLE